MAVDEQLAAVEPAPVAPPVTAVRTRARAAGWVRIVLGLLAAGLASAQVHALLGFSRFVTDEDQTLLWLAGRELAHLRIDEPNFYGQTYNTVFEALPGELLHLAGVSLSLAAPFGTTLMATACWGVLAVAAALRGRPVAAAAALALPLILRLPYLLLFNAPRGVLSGDLLAAVAVGGFVLIRQPHRGRADRAADHAGDDRARRSSRRAAKICFVSRADVAFRTCARVF